MSIEHIPRPVSLMAAVEAPLAESRRHSRRSLWVGALALSAVAGGGWVYHEKTADPCSASFKLAPETASENVLSSRDGTQFKLLIGHDKRNLTEIGFLVYGAQEKPAAFDTFSGDVRIVDVAPADIHSGPEATFRVNDDTELLIEVTSREVKTQCVAASPVAAQH